MVSYGGRKFCFLETRRSFEFYFLISWQEKECFNSKFRERVWKGEMKLKKKRIFERGREF